MTPEVKSAAVRRAERLAIGALIVAGLASLAAAALMIAAIGVVLGWWSDDRCADLSGVRDRVVTFGRQDPTSAALIALEQRIEQIVAGVGSDQALLPAIRRSQADYAARFDVTDLAPADATRVARLYARLVQGGASEGIRFQRYGVEADPAVHYAAFNWDTVYLRAEAVFVLGDPSVAGVLAHELGHDQRDIVRLDIIRKALTVDAYTQAQLRARLEARADARARRMLHCAGFDPAVLLTLIETFPMARDEKALRLAAAATAPRDALPDCARLAHVGEDHIGKGDQVMAPEGRDVKPVPSYQPPQGHRLADRAPELARVEVDLDLAVCVRLARLAEDEGTTVDVIVERAIRHGLDEQARRPRGAQP